MSTALQEPPHKVNGEQHGEQQLFAALPQPVAGLHTLEDTGEACAEPHTPSQAAAESLDVPAAWQPSQDPAADHAAQAPADPQPHRPGAPPQALPELPATADHGSDAALPPMHIPQIQLTELEPQPTGPEGSLWQPAAQAASSLEREKGPTRTVTWPDMQGQELASVREFEPSEPGEYDLDFGGWDTKRSCCSLM